MIELPEAVNLSKQLAESLGGKRVREVIAAHSPHKWAWFHGDPAGYGGLLEGRSLLRAGSVGGFVDVELDQARLIFGEGVSLRLHRPGDKRPAKHQLLVEFDGDLGLSASVRMYGWLWASGAEPVDNRYYQAAGAVPSPLEAAFDSEYFERLAAPPAVRALSAKAFLATEQRIPGLGNGVLQDILYEAHVHPKRRVETLGVEEMEGLFRATKSVLAEMAKLGGRDTERDLHGRPGGYSTRMSRNTVGQPCQRCGSILLKAQYLGGAVYFCPGCQAP